MCSILFFVGAAIFSGVVIILWVVAQQQRLHQRVVFVGANYYSVDASALAGHAHPAAAIRLHLAIAVQML